MKCLKRQAMLIGWKFCINSNKCRRRRSNTERTGRKRVRGRNQRLKNLNLGIQYLKDEIFRRCFYKNGKEEC